MSGFAIVVEIRLKPGARERFVQLVGANAAASVRDEPGCRRFNVLVPEEGPDRVALYEIYDDADAFATHLKTPHFARYKAASADLIAEQSLVRYRISEHAKV